MVPPFTVSGPRRSLLSIYALGSGLTAVRGFWDGVDETPNTKREYPAIRLTRIYADCKVPVKSAKT